MMYVCVCVCVYMPAHVWVIVKFFIFFDLSRPDSTWNDARMIFFFFYFLLKNFGNAPAHLGRNDTETNFFFLFFGMMDSRGVALSSHESS